MGGEGGKGVAGRMGGLNRMDGVCATSRAKLTQVRGED